MVTNAQPTKIQIINILDAWFISRKSFHDGQEDELRLIYPNTWGSVNKTTTIIDEDDVNDLKAEVNDKTLRFKN